MPSTKSRSPRTRTRTRSGPASYLAPITFLLAALIINSLWPLPLWVAGLYLGASILCFIVYAVDKSAARAGRRRVSERTLLLLGLIGGWPGAVVAQQTLRHKTQKVSFRRAFWVSVVANVVVFVVLATPLVSMLVEWAANQPR
ncbi:hypothetical protein GCM10022381_32330 [Leifsonia kafniensis]|uniref:DUF1294 domain-containing protein n=1 Tax=Leifsonia kafniensis TaxID=475957 RepID=A0ABP7KV34_9MICO